MATETLSYAETSELLNASLASLHADAAIEDALVESRLYPGALGLLDTMRRYDVDELTVDAFDRGAPREALESIFEASQREFSEHGIPAPDLEFYQQAMDFSRNENVPMPDVMSRLDSLRPYEVSSSPEESSLLSLSSDDTVSVADISGPVMASAQTTVEAEAGLEIAAVNYQEYDVHLMAYPLGTGEVFGIGWQTQDSHAFVVVTERDANPFDPENALFVTRGGPDFTHAPFGDVIVRPPAESASDLDADGVFLLESTTIRGDINQIIERGTEFGEFINDSDVNYWPTDLAGEGRNSNTYAGDVYELLTGDEPDNPHHGVFRGSRTPALDNDLLDYETTDYAPFFD